MLKYSYNSDVIKIDETANGNDIEFHIQVLQEEPYLKKLKLVQRHFDDNRVFTDVLFYAHANHHYRVIVRKDYYNDFVIELMRHHLLQSVEWSS